MISKILAFFKRLTQKHIYYALGVICVGFILLTILVIFHPQSFIDVEFSQEVQEHQNALLDNIMITVSWFGYTPGNIVIVLAAALLFFLFKYRKEAVFVLLTSLSGVLSTVVKILVHRPRPTEPLVRIVQKVNQESFPSGHVLFYIAFFGFLTALMYHLSTIPKGIRLSISGVSLLLIFTIPFSRMYLGAHWFSDVLGGFLLGILFLYVLCFYYLRVKQKQRLRKT